MQRGERKREEEEEQHTIIKIIFVYRGIISPLSFFQDARPSIFPLLFLTHSCMIQAAPFLPPSFPSLRIICLFVSVKLVFFRPIRGRLEPVRRRAELEIDPACLTD